MSKLFGSNMTVSCSTVSDEFEVMLEVLTVFEPNFREVAAKYEG